MKQRHHIKDPQESAGGSFSFPGKIVKKQGALAIAAGMAEGRAAVFADSYVIKTFGPAIGGGIENIRFSGECSPGEFFRVKTILLEKKIRTLIALGGGKTLDLAKYLKREIPGLKLISAPTSAATCAAYTPVTVLYDEQGVYMDTLDTACPDVLIFDYGVFGTLPMPFFAAGAMDTLAKYYETASYFENGKDVNSYDAFIYETAGRLRKELKKLVLKKWVAQDIDTRRRLAEINILESGYVSCLGRFTATAGMAHAVAHAITASKKAGEFLHGEHVSAGLMVQEYYLENKDRLAEIEGLAAVMELPVRLSALGVVKEEMPEIIRLYDRIKAREKILVPEREELMYNIIKRNF